MSTSSASINLMHLYQTRLKGIDVVSLSDHQRISARYRDGDSVWDSTQKFKLGHITGITSPESVVVNGTLWHMEDVHTWLSSGLPVDDDIDVSSGSNEW